MLGRRGVARRNRQYRDRDRDRDNFFSSHVPAHQPAYAVHHQSHHSQPTSPAAAPPIPHTYQNNIHAALHHPDSPPDGLTNVTFTWPDLDCHRPNAVLVASFDNFLHHRMYPRNHAHHPPDLIVMLPVPPGRHRYKFLVDGRWCTHPGLHSRHPIEMSDDGVKHHVIIVDAFQSSTLLNTATLASETHHMQDLNHERTAPQNDSHATVFRSASASAVAPANSTSPPSTTVPRPSIPHVSKPFCKPAPASLPDTSRPPGSRFMAPRGSSFNTTPGLSGTPSTLSTHALSRIPVEQRKSLLHRVGSGWRRRFSNRPDAIQGHGDGTQLGSALPSPSLSLSRSNFPTPDRSGSAIFRGNRDPHQQNVSNMGGRYNVTLFPSSSEPVVSRTTGQYDDKENVTHGNSNMSQSSSMRSTSGVTPDRRRVPLRGSSRNTAVKVSGPTRVDEPRNMDEVNKQADNWRQMARHLQDNLHDPLAARELLEKAIAHREKHGLDTSAANAQVHTDLARNLSKADLIVQAEQHLRIGLRIYNKLGMGSEHVADLQLYVGVMVDRQKRRPEAEELYKTALHLYKSNGVKGNNMNIAIKNLVLNLKKQNRLGDVPSVYAEYGDCDE